MLNSILNGWLAVVTGRPKLVLLFVLILVAVAIAGLPRFKLEASADSLTLENDTDLEYFRQLSKAYDSGDFLVLTYKPNTPLFGQESLDRLRALQDELATVEGVSSINSILNVPLLYSPLQSLREISTQTRTLDTPGLDKGMAEKEFLNSPIYRKLILSQDAKTTAIQLNLAVDHRYLELVEKRDALRAKRAREGLTAQESQALKIAAKEFLDYRTAAETRSAERVQAIRDIVAKYRDGAEIFIGGVTMITADMVSFIKKDLIVFGGASLLFMVFVLAIIFRSVRFVVLPLTTCLTAVVLMLGLVSWLDWRLTVISSNFVALLLIISLAIMVHLIVRYREFAAENPEWSQERLVSETVRFMAKPCLYTVLTTMVAFISLVVSDIRPVIDFGWMMTIGLLFALTLAFLLLPAAMMLLPRESVAEKAKDGKATAGKPLTLYCSAFVERRGGIVVAGALIIAILSVVGISRLAVENSFVDYFHKDTEIYKGLSVIDKELGGTTSLEILIDAKASEALTAMAVEPDLEGEEDPFDEVSDDEFDEFEDEFGEGGDAFDEFEEEGDAFGEEEPENTSSWMTVAGLQQIEVIHNYLDGLEEIGKVSSLATLYQVGRDINGSLNNFELAIMQKSLSPEVKDILIAPYLNVESDQARITLRIIDTYTGLKRKKLVDRIRNDIANLPGMNIEHVRFSGLLVLYNNMLQSLFSSQIVTLGAVFLGIAFMFMVLFRSFVLAIVGIVPTILAAVSILGGMGLAGIPLDMMTITIAAITVGIGVDNAIHYIYRFRTELAKNGDYIESMHRSHGSIGRAMYYTSVIIIFGFSIMVLSEFIPTIYFGLLTGIAMLAALMGALLLLPKLILLVKPFSVQQA